MISPTQTFLMRRTVGLCREFERTGWPANPFAVMLLEDGRRLEVNAATFVRLAINCLQEVPRPIESLVFAFSFHFLI